MPLAPEPVENLQTREVFAAEAERIVGAERKVMWRQPSRDEGDAPEAAAEPSVLVGSGAAEEIEEWPVPQIAGGATRGTVLHKLLEEVLTGETADDQASLHQRATELLSQLGMEPASDPRYGIAPTELAATLLRTLGGRGTTTTPAHTRAKPGWRRPAGGKFRPPLPRDPFSPYRTAGQHDRTWDKVWGDRRMAAENRRNAGVQADEVPPRQHKSQLRRRASGIAGVRGQGASASMAPPSQVERCPPNRVNSNSIGGDLWKAIEWAEAEQKAGRLKGLNLNAPMQSQ